MSQTISAGISKRLSSLRMNSSGNSSGNGSNGTADNHTKNSTHTDTPPPSSSSTTSNMITQRRHTDPAITPVPSPKAKEEQLLPSSMQEEKSELDSTFDPLDVASYPPDLMDPGIDMIRVTRRKRVRRLFKLNIPSLVLTWNTKSSSRVEMDKIQSIRVGDDAKNYREEFNVSSEFHDLWITVIYIRSVKDMSLSSSSSSATSLASSSLSSTSQSSSSGPLLYNDLKALHMIAPTRRNFEIMVDTLTTLSRWSREQESLINCVNVNEFSKIKWENKMKKSDRQVLSFEDVRKLALELHIYMDRSYLESYFQQCDTTKNGNLDFTQFQKFVNKLRHRPELNKIFSVASGRKIGSKIVESDFKRFLREVQNERYNDEYIHTLFVKFSVNGKGEHMNATGLANYLHSNYSQLLEKVEETDPNYYTHPLTDYFISSSHNTYLLGKQVHGYSSIEGYIHALQRGCRCIEIDIWDGDNGPIVTHGRTLTSSVDFKLVIDTIRKYAFISTPYPLIISLEIKCSKETQLKCANIMETVFGEMLVIDPINENSVLPSPSELRHKILVKVKKSNTTTIVEPLISGTTHSSFSTFSSSTQSDDMHHTYTSSRTDTDDSITKTLSNGESSTSTSTDAIKSFKKFVSHSTQKTPVISELSSLSPYLVGIKFRNFSLPESKTFNHVFSFSDRALLLLLRDKTKVISILKHNKRGMMRIYPSVVRFRSDNFNPIKFWELGCQMVATNWQIWDCGEQLCESLFVSSGSGTGYSGYRLKPESLRRDENDITNGNDKEIIKFKNLQSLEFNVEKNFELCIISGQQLPKPRDLATGGSDGYTPWIEMEIYNVLPVHGEIVHLHEPPNINNGTSVDEELDGCDGNYTRVTVDDKNDDIDKGKEPVDENEPNRVLYQGSDNHGTLEMHHVDPNSSNPHWNARYKTRLAENPGNAFSPRWNIACRLNYKTNKHDLSFVRIVVKCANNGSSKTNVISKVGSAVVKKNTRHDFTIGSWCGKLSELKNGYRYIRLGDVNGEELIYSSVFVKVTKS